MLLGTEITCWRKVKNAGSSRTEERNFIIFWLSWRVTVRPKLPTRGWIKMELPLDTSNANASADSRRPWPLSLPVTSSSWKNWLMLYLLLVPSAPVKLNWIIFFKNFPPKRFSWKRFGLAVNCNATWASSLDGNIPLMASLRMDSSPGIWLAYGLCMTGDDSPETWNSSLMKGGQGLE